MRVTAVSCCVLDVQVLVDVTAVSCCVLDVQVLVDASNSTGRKW